jgi:hypothetical protein
MIRGWHLLLILALTGFVVSSEQPVRQRSLPSCAPFRTAECNCALPNDSQQIGGLRTIDRRHVDSLHRYSRLLFTAAIGNLVVLASIFTLQIPKMPRRINPPRLSEDMLEGMTLAWKTALFLSLFTLLAIVTFCTKPYTQFMPIFARDILHVGAPGLGLFPMAPGASAILGGAHPRIRHTISTAAPTTAFSRWRLCFIHHTIRSLGELSAFAPLAFFRGRISDHLPLFNRHPFASLHGRKQPGTDHVSVWTNQSRSWAKAFPSVGRNLDRRSH